MRTSRMWYPKTGHLRGQIYRLMEHQNCHRRQCSTQLVVVLTSSLADLKPSPELLHFLGLSKLQLLAVVIRYLGNLLTLRLQCCSGMLHHPRRNTL